MKWEKLGKRSWMKRIADHIYCILVIPEHLEQTPLYTSRSFGLKVMTVDVIKQAKEMKQIQSKYQDFFMGSAVEVESNVAKMYVLEKAKDIVKVREEDYKALQSYVKNRYGLEVPNKDEVTV